MCFGFSLCDLLIGFEFVIWSFQEFSICELVGESMICANSMVLVSIRDLNSVDILVVVHVFFMVSFCLICACLSAEFISFKSSWNCGQLFDNSCSIFFFNESSIFIKLIVVVIVVCGSYIAAADQTFSFIQVSTIFLVSRNVIFLQYSLLYITQEQMWDGFICNLSILVSSGKPPPCSLVSLATPFSCWISFAALSVMSIFFIFKAPQKYGNLLLYPFEAMFTFLFLRYYWLVKCQNIGIYLYFTPPPQIVIFYSLRQLAFLGLLVFLFVQLRITPCFS